MRNIDPQQIRQAVAELAKEANTSLRPDIQALIRRAARQETGAINRPLYHILLESIRLSAKNGVPICQDTGLPVVFADIGRDISVNSTLKNAIIDGIEIGYRESSLRASIVDPLRRGSPQNAPPVIHIDFTLRKGLTLTVLPKGFGSENKSRLFMLRPTAEREEIMKHVVTAVREAGASACPPFFVGIGIGGTADYSLLLSKKALLRPFGRPSPEKTNDAFAKEVLRELNYLSIGICGLKSKTTCLGVNIESAPTHIAGLPLGVSVSCWVMRSASRTIL